MSELTEEEERRRIRREFPGHPVPLHPRTGRVDEYERREVDEAWRFVMRDEMRENARLFQQPTSSLPPQRRPWWALPLAIAGVILICVLLAVFFVWQVPL
jgi:hypothetical protein